MSKQPNLTQKIEAILFLNNGPKTMSELTRELQVSALEVAKAIEELKQILDNRAICIIESDNSYELAISPNLRDFTATLTTDSAPTLSQSSLEVLTIIAYTKPCTKATIDEIRGTPSDNSLRALLSRDLITQSTNKNTSKTAHYQLTSLAWRCLGITGRDDLPPKPKIKKVSSDATQ